MASKVFDTSCYIYGEEKPKTPIKGQRHRLKKKEEKEEPIWPVKGNPIFFKALWPEDDEDQGGFRLPDSEEQMAEQEAKKEAAKFAKNAAIAADPMAAAKAVPCQPCKDWCVSVVSCYFALQSHF